MSYSYVFKTSSRCLTMKFSGCLAKTSWRRLQDIFKMSWRRFDEVLKMFSRYLDEILPRSFPDVFKTSSRYLANIDVFKTSSRCIIKLRSSSLTHLQDVFKTFLWRTAKTITYRKIFLGPTLDKFMVRVQIFQQLTLWLHRNFWSSFSKTLDEVTVSTNKDILVKVGYQERCYCLSK